MQSKRSTFLVFGTTAFVIFALFFVFWLSSRHSGSKPIIQVPSPSHTEPNAPPELALLNDPEDYLTFDLTPDTVGPILSGLNSPEAYSLTLISSVYADDRRADTQVSVFFQGGVSRLSLADHRPQRELLLTKNRIYAWSADSPTVSELPIGIFDPARTAKMPNLQALVDCPSERILLAEFVEYGGLWTIHIRHINEHGLTECNYVAIDCGLIIHNEVYDGEKLVLEMTVNALTFTEPEASLFLLPDGSLPY